jgi:hypothetical protein
MEPAGNHGLGERLEDPFVERRVTENGADFGLAAASTRL